MIDRLLDALRERGSRQISDHISENLRRQPLMREYWRAEHKALEQLFRELSDQELNTKVVVETKKMFKEMKKRKRVPSGQDDEYLRLCRGNAMRKVWAYTSGLDEEMGYRFTKLWNEEMIKEGVYDRFQQTYVDAATGKSGLITTNPNKPYF